MGLFTQEDPIGIAGGLNLYGYANGDPINYSDPFGLCPDAEDPDCSKTQTLLLITVGGTAAAADLGGNVEAGWAIGTQTGDAVFFVRGGRSYGGGAGGGISAGLVAGTLNDFGETTDPYAMGGAGFALTGAAPGAPAVTLLLSGDSPGLLSGVKVGESGIGAWMDTVGAAYATRSEFMERLWKLAGDALRDLVEELRPIGE